MPTSLQYTVYGHDGCDQFAPVLRFSGQRKESATGQYLLGNGYRAFNPVLMRFHSPDSLSPMGAGGLNCYAYCAGDPINNIDPSGHMLKSIFKRPKRREQAPKPFIFPPSAKQREFNELMNSRVKEIGKLAQQKRVNDFEYSGCFTAKGMGHEIERISQADNWSQQELNLVEVYNLNLHRNYSLLDSTDVNVLNTTTALMNKIAANLPAEAQKATKVHWKLGEDGKHVRITTG
ncbi:RHS repeat-associated core domain-containing protein [Pseudomonas kurunegalensis]|uniref:RHS repeat-associated core domain-containing protein n=1 Tax=Pseudomonas kurunegalensis TaxID=485880 RepID=UPI00355837AC